MQHSGIANRGLVEVVHGEIVQMSKITSLRCVVLAVGVAMLCACAASVSTIVTGKERPAISPGAVKVYSSPPQKFEDVAIVSGTARGGGTAQGQTNNVLDGLKKAAAKLGANGILIASAGAQNAGAVVFPNNGYPIVAPVTTQAITAKAIYVIEE
jgi:hypothetical protein